MLIITKLLLLALCIIPIGIDRPEHLFALLGASILSLLTDIVKPKLRIVCTFLLIALCIFYPSFLYFLPVLIYDLYFFYGDRTIITLLPIFFVKDHRIYFFTLTFFALYLSYMEKADQHQIKVYQQQIDSLHENLLVREEKLEFHNREMNAQIEIAILSERNRIAREIHDSVGHALSSCILQTEVLKLRSTDDDQTQKIQNLQQTLQNGMQDIRISLHNLHDSSLDLRQEMENLIANFPLDVEFNFFSTEQMDYALKLAILSTTKELLTNVAKHSNAKKVQVQFMEHKAYYSLSVKNDGARMTPLPKNPQGIGLVAVEDFAKKYNGHANYGYRDNGFFVHLTIQKTNSTKNHAENS